MSPISARRRAGILLYTAIQFVVLVAIAMAVYAGGTYADPLARGYDFSASFLSELGATHTWSGASNGASAVLFGIALGGLGLAVIGFAAAWPTFAFGRRRARAAGIAAQLFATCSGAAFVAVAVTPVDLHLDRHNAFVIAAFGLLLGYAASMTVLAWRNGASRVRVLANVAYMLAVGAYVVVVALAVRDGHITERGHLALVLSQKAIAGASILYIVYLTLATRREVARQPSRSV